MKKHISKVILSCAIIALSVGSCTKDNGTPPAGNNNNNNIDTTPKEPAFLADSANKTRTAVLEDFTGVRCVYCPDGHDRAKAIDDDYKERFIIIATHAGGYATPATGWPNYTTPYGNAILNQAMITGFPSGTISRMPAEELGATPMKPDGMGMGRTEWRTAAEMAMGMPAPVNLGAKATFDPATRKLTVRVDMYYTADETVANNLNVAILQDNIVSRQITMSSGSKGDYNYIQNNVLRHYITGQWGEVIAEPKTKGSKITKTYTYDVPADYNGTGTEGGGAVVAEDLKIVAFVTQGRKTVLNAVEVDVK